MRSAAMVPMSSVLLPSPDEQGRAADMRVFSLFNKSRLPIAAALVAAALAGPLSWQAAGGATSYSRPTASAWSASIVPHYRHITVIADVGHDFGAIYHNKFAPVMNRLAAEYGLASHYYTTSDPDIADIVA